MSSELAPLLEYLQRRFDPIDRRVEDLGQDFSTLQGAVDAYAKRADGHFEEMPMLPHGVERHGRSPRQVSDELGAKLKH